MPPEKAPCDDIMPPDGVLRHRRDMKKGTGDTHCLESCLLSRSSVLDFEKCSLGILGPQLVVLCGKVMEPLTHGGLEQERWLIPKTTHNHCSSKEPGFDSQPLHNGSQGV